MLFRDDGSEVLAISQLAHAWIAGQILRAWSENLGEPLLFATELHDIGWLDWEAIPTFNPQTGRPHLFREVAPAVHAPMWAQGVERALAAWGGHVALLVSRHGGLIYRRYARRGDEADAAAVDNYLAGQAAFEGIWAGKLGLSDEALNKETALLAFADAVSLALCGDLKPPLDLEAPGRDGETVRFRLAERSGRPFEFVLSPWPFREDVLIVEGEGRPLPAGGRFPDEAAMRNWLAAPRRAVFDSVLRRA
ncbi:MAG TPA: DUF3891 family protein [Roseiarcus sp.]|nr:DUF3891 family protein [Roseiarcus sp.]